MKKTYLAPAALTVVLDTLQMMAESLPVGGSDDTIDDENDILTKEDKTAGKDIWDQEW